jgi:hypothetical protein
MIRVFPLFALLLTACMPKVFPEDELPFAEERPVIGTFPSNFNTVWESTLEVIGDAAPLQEFEPDRGYIETSWVNGSSDYIFKNYGGTRIPESVHYRYKVWVMSNGDTTEVKLIKHEQIEKDMISIDAEFTGSIYHWIDIPSSTEKEHALLEQIVELIDQRQGGTDYDYQY